MLSAIVNPAPTYSNPCKAVKRAARTIVAIKP